MVLFASVTTTIAFLEVVVSFAVQTLHITRGKATLICAFCATVLGIPCALSFGLLEPFHLFGMTLFELVDYAISNLFLPVSAIFTCIFLGWIWKSSRAVKEVTNQGSLRFPVAKLWAFWVKFVLPVLIFGIFLTSLGIM